MTEYLRLPCLGRLVITSLLVLFTASDVAAQTADTTPPSNQAQQAETNADGQEKAETGSGSHNGYPVIQLPPDADPEDENWKGIDLSPKPPVLPKSPEQELHHLLPPQGYDLEVVVSEPAIEQPGAIAFDGNGRMFVLELRSYMLDADATGEQEPISRISRHEDTDGDGVYDVHTVFVDSLVFPRFVLPFGAGTILTMESNQDNIYQYVDTDGDGVADEKELFDTNFGNAGNVEHQQAFLHWGMDNWLYSSVNAFRIRWTPDGVIREPTGSSRSQWGVTHDNDGKVWFQGGASGVPSYFQFPIHYGNIDVEDPYAEGFRVPYGAPIKLADMQGGMDEVRMPDGSLNNVTGAAGSDVFRGDRLPEALVGQYFYGEPVARIVRQVDPVVTEGLTRLHNAYQDQQSEFIRSTDPLFRPVDMATAPDGTMYLVDMYHGIIQEAQWTQPGDYLRAKIEQYQLDKVIGLGRIFRLTHEGIERDQTQPRMLEETPLELVEHLDHPNGWWRDKAQQLLVLHQDRSVVPALEDKVENADNLLGRFHALWTLEGLGALEADLVRALLDDPDPRMRVQALRASETLYKAGDVTLAADYRRMIGDRDTDVVIQAMLTASELEIPAQETVLQEAMASNKAQGVQVVGEQLLNPPSLIASGGFGRSRYTDVEQNLLQEGMTAFNNLCAQCHGVKGTGTPAGPGQTIAPSLVSSKRVQSHPEYVIKTLIHGIKGPIEGATYAGGTMVGMAENPDEWIAAVASFIRTQLANDASFVTPEQVADVRAATVEQDGPYTYEELLASIPYALEPSPSWEVSASHSVPTRLGASASAAGAFNHEGWTTGEQQKPGMWFQVDLAETVNLTEIQFDSPARRRGRGPDAPPPLMTSPGAYRLEVSTDGNTWTTVTEGASADEHVSIPFDPVQARALRITQTGTTAEDAPWSMRGLKLFARPNAATQP